MILDKFYRSKWTINLNADVKVELEVDVQVQVLRLVDKNPKEAK
jgi:hypothetical protein